MQFLLSCAKTMADKPVLNVALNSVPIFKAEAQSSALILQEYNVEQLTRILKCSENIAVQNKKRYWSFFDEDQYAQAVLSYTGVAYKSLNVKDFDDADFHFAQSHMWITSFLYGMLRPMDMIHSYRLEGNVKLYDDKSMFDFWKPRLTDLLIDCVKADDGILIHLATEEMTHLFDWKRIKREVNVFEPQFLVDDGKKRKIVTVYAKMCRGAMARFIIKNRVEAVRDLQSFCFEGFEYDGMVAYDNSSRMNFILN